MSKERKLLERLLNNFEQPVTGRFGDLFDEVRDCLSTPEPKQDLEPTKAEVAVYLFAEWLTCQPGIMEVGAYCDTSPMAQAIDQYFQEHPERMHGIGGGDE